MTGYASNQFWNFGSTYEVGKTLARTSDDNPNFIWPRPFQPDVYNPVTGTQTVDTRLQRGFIRGIYPAVLGGKSISSGSTVKQRRLFFQFNPETIDRSVEMNAMVANPLLQDPSQIFQPVAGTAAFSFQLLFNREAEVVSARNATNQTSNGKRVTDTANPLTSSLDIYGGTVNGKGVNYQHSDVANLGVLADLYVLDSIIGQGITPDLVNFIRDYFSTASNATQSYNSKTGGPSAATFDTTGFDTNIEKNFGNSAFLSPLPIRIVFSSLFMVEGFVETSSVRFAKFSSNYVPTVCAVNLNIRALYIGFAKEEAYLTSALKVAVTDMQAQVNQDKEAIRVAKDIATWGTHFTYESTSLAKQYSNTPNSARLTEFFPHTYDTFYDFWNEGRWPASSGKASGGANITFKGSNGYGIPEVTSYVGTEVQKKVQNGDVSWSLSSKIVLDEYLPDKTTYVQKLVDAPIYYRSFNTSGGAMGADLTNEQLVANANKATSPTKPRQNRYGVSLPNYGDQNGMPMFTSASNIVRMTIQHTISFKTTTSSGPYTESINFEDSMFVTKTKKTSPGTGISWEELDNGGLKFNLPNSTKPSIDYKDVNWRPSQQ